MTDEQWKKIKSLYTEARKVESGERAAFLTAACGGDEQVRREAELLLEYGEKAEAASFLETHISEMPPSGPSDHLLPELSDGEGQTVACSWTGRSIAHYAVAELIGVGGMGEV